MENENQAPMSPAPQSSDGQNWLWVLVVVVVLGVLGVTAFLMKDQLMVMVGLKPVTMMKSEENVVKQEEPSAPVPEKKTENMMENKIEAAATVVFDGQKFTPATVTVKKGQTVKFTDTSTVHMEVASAMHPTHLVYPGFDQGKDATYKDKAEYYFTFTKVGSWKYHNHTPFFAGGTVVVTE